MHYTQLSTSIFFQLSSNSNQIIIRSFKKWIYSTNWTSQTRIFLLLPSMVSVVQFNNNLRGIVPGIAAL
ncbi:hypothetical protein CANARDRAFT_207210 [[Candida] arabinofermentans NRRL YB-2248]|uniref:Uncharacterized protein n=1 Tax=[Candida] arabinofermentans NRRL YB-2248 TaxID=983967 RepID=A0A1E4T2L7_9ASCO|nr:hypothetical protein CANARDRAFT_207210 [[Candida] arabinofermentans NRRL YB-2248]